MKGRLGKRGQLVRAYIERGVVAVRWPDPENPRRYESWPDTPAGRAEAKAFAEGVYDRLTRLAAGQPVGPTYQPLTLREVWTAYLTAEDHLRPATERNYAERWRKFELFAGGRTLATDISRETLDQFRKAMRGNGHKTNQVRGTVAVVKRVIAWAVDRDLLPPSKVTAYRFKTPRDERTEPVAAYTLAEAEAILAELDPRDPRQWRAYVATALFAFSGGRQRAARHLEWTDVDFVGRRLHWRPELDKMGKDRWQPIPAALIDALWVAYGWRTAYGYAGAFILFRPAMAHLVYDARRSRWHESARRAARAGAVEDRPWTYSAYNLEQFSAQWAAYPQW